jgi:hypothetical protein
MSLTHQKVVKSITQAIEKGVQQVWNELKFTPWDMNNSCEGTELVESVCTDLNLPRNQLFVVEFAAITNADDDTKDNQWTHFVPDVTTAFNIVSVNELSMEDIIAALIQYANVSHTWLVFNDFVGGCLHFDAETPNGVDNPLKLPAFARILNGTKRMRDGEDITSMADFLKRMRNLSRSNFCQTQDEFVMQLHKEMNNNPIPSLITYPADADTRSKNELERAEARAYQRGLVKAKSLYQNGSKHQTIEQ